MLDVGSIRPLTVISYGGPVLTKSMILPCTNSYLITMPEPLGANKKHTPSLIRMPSISQYGYVTSKDL